MKRLGCLFLVFFLLIRGINTFAQDNGQEVPQLPAGDTLYAEPVYDEIIYEDEEAVSDYRAQGPFRLLDSLRGQLGVFALSTPFAGRQTFGGGMDAQAWYTSSLSVGFSVCVAGRRIDQTFGYAAAEPRILYYNVSLFNELMLLRWYGLEVASRLYTGYSAFHLDDRSVMVPYTWYDDYGNAFEGEKPLPVAKNHFFHIAPAAVLRCHISPRIMLEGSFAYNWFVGGASFGRSSDFSNYQAQLGFKVEF